MPEKNLLEPGSVFQHLLVAYFAFYLPLRAFGYSLYRKLRGKTASPPTQLDKVRFYRQKTTMQWLATSCVVVSMGGLAPLFYAPAKRPLAWDEAETWFLVVVVASVLAWLMLEIVPSPWRAQRRAALMKDLERLADIVPETRHEQRWWLWVCVTASVCEELIYRGFLIRFLQQSPYGLAPVSSLFLSSLAFGAIHFWWGARIALYGGIGGMMLSALFFLSGNLSLPIMVHAFVDARILWIPANNNDNLSGPGAISLNP